MSTERFDANEGVYAKTLGGGGVSNSLDLFAVSGDVQYGGKLVDARPWGVVSPVPEVCLEAAVEGSFTKGLQYDSRKKHVHVHSFDLRFDED